MTVRCLPAFGIGIGYLEPRILVERARAGAPFSGRMRSFPEASTMSARRTSVELPHYNEKMTKKREQLGDSLGDSLGDFVFVCVWSCGCVCVCVNDRVIVI